MIVAVGFIEITHESGHWVVIVVVLFWGQPADHQITIAKWGEPLFLRQLEKLRDIENLAH